MNRIIVVTGGAGGIGRCIVAHFASQGDSVYPKIRNYHPIHD